MPPCIWQSTIVQHLSAEAQRKDGRSGLIEARCEGPFYPLCLDRQVRKLLVIKNGDIEHNDRHKAKQLFIAGYS